MRSGCSNTTTVHMTGTCQWRVVQPTKMRFNGRERSISRLQFSAVRQDTMTTIVQETEHDYQVIDEYYKVQALKRVGSDRA